MTALQTADELPREYLESLHQQCLNPLWPQLRALLPYGDPEQQSRPTHWAYDRVRPLLMQAGDLTPIEKAERRVLVLCNPGLGLENLQATPSIYLGLQLILPGEDAPNHRHTPSAIRMIVEGGGGYTTVEGERLPMEPGDLILTPSGLWHEHGHEGDTPVVWMDALDLPLIYYLEHSYAEEAPLQNAPTVPDASQTRYRQAGLLPYNELRSTQAYPMMRYPWKDTREALDALATQQGREELIHLAYVNPVNGEECLPILGFSALMLRPGAEVKLPRRSCSTVLNAIEGNGVSEINGQDFKWAEHDITAIPPHAQVQIQNSSSDKPAYLFMVDDAPLHRKLKIYQEFRW